MKNLLEIINKDIENIIKLLEYDYEIGSLWK